MPMEARFVPTRKRKDFRFAITAALKLGEKEADPMNGWVPTGDQRVRLAQSRSGRLHQTGYGGFADVKTAILADKVLNSEYADVVWSISTSPQVFLTGSLGGHR